MRALIQRVGQGQVTVKNKVVGKIGSGHVVFLGIAKTDDEQKTIILAQKLLNLRIMADDQDKMNRSIQDVQGEILVISQFTLYADSTKGNRPSFIQAAPPAKAEKLYQLFITTLRQSGLKVETGKFGAYMTVELSNDGPVTILLET